MSMSINTHPCVQLLHQDGFCCQVRSVICLYASTARSTLEILNMPNPPLMLCPRTYQGARYRPSCQYRRLSWSLVLTNLSGPFCIDFPLKFPNRETVRVLGFGRPVSMRSCQGPRYQSICRATISWEGGSVGRQGGSF